MVSVNTHLSVMDDGFVTNTYIVTDKETGETAVIDPGVNDEKLIEKLKEKQKQKYEKELLDEEIKIIDDIVSSRRMAI